jgi:hypothetical protein
MRLFACCLLLLLFSCSEEKIPANVLPRQRMQSVLWDLFRADELLNQKQALDTSFKRDPAADTLYQKVYTVHGITKEQFRNSYNWYQLHPKEMKVLIDSLHAFSSRRVPMAPAY